MFKVINKKGVLCMVGVLAPMLCVETAYANMPDCTIRPNDTIVIPSLDHVKLNPSNSLISVVEPKINTVPVLLPTAPIKIEKGYQNRITSARPTLFRMGGAIITSHDEKKESDNGYSGMATGPISFTSDNTFAVTGDITNTGTISSTNTPSLINSGFVDLDGVITNTAVLSSNGTFPVRSDDFMDLVDGIDNSGMITNTGTHSNSAVMSMGGYPSVVKAGAFNVGSTVTDSVESPVTDIDVNVGVLTSSVGPSGSIQLSGGQASGNAVIAVSDGRDLAFSPPSPTTLTFDTSAGIEYIQAGNITDIILSDNVVNTSEVNTSEKDYAIELDYYVTDVSVTGSGGIDITCNSVETESTVDAPEIFVDVTLPVDLHGGINDATMSTQNQFMNTVSHRMSDIRNNNEQMESVATGDSAYKNTTWARTYATTAQQGYSNGVTGYNYDLYGVAFGIDRDLSNNLSVGTSASYADTQVESLRGDTNIQSKQVALYATKNSNLWYVDAMLGLSINAYEGYRNIVVGQVSDVAYADYDGIQYSAKLSGGYNFILAQSLRLTPIVSVQYSSLHQSTYEENGSSADLIVQSEDVNSLKSGVGIKMAKSFDVWGMSFDPRLNVMWLHDYLIGENETINTLSDSPSVSFKSRGSRPSKDTINIGTGIDLHINEQFRLSADYDFSTRKSYKSHTGMLQASFVF